MTRNCIPEEKSVVKEFFFVKLLVKLACVSKLPFFFHKLKKKHTKPTKTLLTNLEKKRKSREREGKKFGDLVRLGQVKYK